MLLWIQKSQLEPWTENQLGILNQDREIDRLLQLGGLVPKLWMKKEH